VLHIDLNDKKKEDLVILSWKVEELTKQLVEKEKNIKTLEENLKIYGEEVKIIFYKFKEFQNQK